MDKNKGKSARPAAPASAPSPPGRVLRPAVHGSLAPQPALTPLRRIYRVLRKSTDEPAEVVLAEAADHLERLLQS